jgi:hypothetical protein
MLRGTPGILTATLNSGVQCDIAATFRLCQPLPAPAAIQQQSLHTVRGVMPTATGDNGISVVENP